MQFNEGSTNIKVGRSTESENYHVIILICSRYFVQVIGFVNGASPVLVREMCL